ncbi:hypothetical protein BLNAU_11755 [Blattamonas nauphoetae]|uniref:Uncharacterized protein n=1 Tax=Blattamonas nauphoetae TaxID=2049346 RepID=A0ABQ9XRC5_9EUKA|nr:hypothetical protein BLNAU_11755 [Blattamonas nauphoetae]
MTEINKTIEDSFSTARSELPSSQFSFSMDCSPFLKWNEKEFETESEKTVIFQSLVATVKLQSAFDDSLEVKAVKLFKSLDAEDEESADAFLSNLGRTTDESLTNFIQSIVVLISSSSQIITTASMKMLDSMIGWCSAKVLLALIKADLIPQLIVTINPQSLSFTEAVDIHVNFTKSIVYSLWLITPDGLEYLTNEDGNEQQHVHETVLQQVLTPLEKYIWYLRVNRSSIIDGEQSRCFLELLARFLRISPSYLPTMEFVLRLPVVLTVPSCLTFFENETSIWIFLFEMNSAQQEWNIARGNKRQMGKAVDQMLRMEGIEDVSEERLQNDRNGTWGGDLIDKSIRWSNTHDMNIPRRG